MMPQHATLAEAARLLNAGRPADALQILQPVAIPTDMAGPAQILRLQALISLGRRREAEALLETSRSLPPDSAETLDALAFFARQLDRHELSNALYARLVDAAPRTAQYWYNYATSERSLGRLAAAANACAHALELDPQLRSAILLRSEVTRATDAANNVVDLKTRLASVESETAAMFLWYALGKELHELGDYDEAFDAFSRGAAARRNTLQYDVRDDEAKLRRIAEVFAAGTAPPPGAPPSRHIFVLGLPRSGTTLVERILGNLPTVRSNNETNNLSTALLENTPPGPEDIFARTARADYPAMAAAYDRLAAGDDRSTHIIEKLPFNYLYIGPLLRAMPTARVVWLHRHPVDACFAMFRTLFGSGYPFSYDFEDLARYYAAYDRLHRHWRDLYGERILHVDYERLVASAQDVGERIAGYCGLPWTATALDLSQNRSASLTASAAQVRGDIYATSAGIWRAYGRRLESLAERLESLGVSAPIG